jgi:GMP synthase (glutamine-hydrolysing)
MYMIRIIDCGSEYVSRFSEILGEASLVHDTVSIKRKGGLESESATGYIVSGAPILFTEEDPKPYLDVLRFLVDVEVPVLGVCFGHQIIGMLHRATIRKGNMVRGSFEIEFLKECELFKDIQNGTRFHEYHEEYINVPNTFEPLARSGSCENEAMKHVSKPLYGVQFHPEMSGEAGERLLKNFSGLCA